MTCAYIYLHTHTRARTHIYIYIQTHTQSICSVLNYNSAFFPYVLINKVKTRQLRVSLCEGDPCLASDWRVLTYPSSADTAAKFLLARLNVPTAMAASQLTRKYSDVWTSLPETTVGLETVHCHVYKLRKSHSVVATDSLIPALFSGSSAKSITSVLGEIGCNVATVGDTPYRWRSSANFGRLVM